MTNLQFLYENDLMALHDFVSCTSHCEDCRAKRYCDDFVASGMEEEWLWLLGEAEQEGAA